MQGRGCSHGATLNTLCTSPYAAPVAPEVVRSQDYSAASDVFALGAILFILLSGTMPFAIRDAPPHPESTAERLARFQPILDGAYAFDAAAWSNVSMGDAGGGGVR